MIVNLKIKLNKYMPRIKMINLYREMRIDPNLILFKL